MHIGFGTGREAEWTSERHDGNDLWHCGGEMMPLIRWREGWRGREVLGSKTKLARLRKGGAVD